MTRREMLLECRDGAVQNLPRLLGMAGGIWGGLSKLVDTRDEHAQTQSPACFPTTAPAEPLAQISEDAGEISHDS
jgi:hypothetical protein